MTVREVLERVVHHPYLYVLKQWNWKAAVLSAATRGAIFFATNVQVSYRAAVTALAVDAMFRVPLAGACAALTEAFRWARPARTAFIAAMIVVPATAHVVEIGVHWWAGTPALWRSVAASVGWSVVSTSFTLFAMRQGIMVVTMPARSLWADLGQFPRLYVQFAAAIPLAAGRVIRRSLGRHRE